MVLAVNKGMVMDAFAVIFSAEITFHISNSVD